MAIFGWDVSSFRNKVTRWRWCRWSSEGTAAPSSAYKLEKVGRSVISTSRRELGWILVLLQECYQFALWRPLAAAAAQVWTRYPLSGARTGTGSAPTGHFLFWSRYPLFQDGVLPQGIRISIPQLSRNCWVSVFDAGSKDLILMFNKSKKGQKNELFYISVQIKNGNSIIANFTQFLCIEMICFGWVGFLTASKCCAVLIFFFSNNQIRLACKITNPYIIA